MRLQLKKFFNESECDVQKELIEFHGEEGYLYMYNDKNT